MFILNKIRDEAIKNIYPSAITVKIINETNEYKAYDSSNNPITLDLTLVENEVDRLTAEYDALDYSRKRLSEYPPMEEQLDYIYHNGLTKWKADMITPVKEKYTKS